MFIVSFSDLFNLFLCVPSKEPTCSGKHESRTHSAVDLTKFTIAIVNAA